MKLINYLLILFFSLTLISCSNEEEERFSPNTMFGDFMVLRVRFDGIQEKPSLPKSKSGSDSLFVLPATQSVRLTDSLIMVTTVELAAPGSEMTKTAAPSLDGSSKILAIVYKIKGDKTILYKAQSFSVSEGKIYLTPWEEFKVVFYSYNSKEAPNVKSMLSQGSVSKDGSPEGVYFSDDAVLKEDFNESSDRGLVWTMIPNTGKITKDTRLPNLLFVPVFTRLQWEISSTGEVITGLEASVVNSYDSASVNVRNLINSGSDIYNIWKPFGLDNHKVKIDFPTQGSRVVTSDKRVFLASEVGSTKLKINGIKIGEISGLSTDVLLGKLSRGYSYLVKSLVISTYAVRFSAGEGGYVSPSGEHKGKEGDVIKSEASANEDYFFVGWYDEKDLNTKLTTGGDIEVDNNALTVKMTLNTVGTTYVAKFKERGAPRITFKDGQLEITRDPLDNGLFFQFGSVLGWDNSDGIQSSNILFNPSNPQISSWNKTWSVGNAFPAQTPEHIKAGKGDPCRLVGLTTGQISGGTVDNGKWRLPTDEDNQAFVGEHSSWTNFKGVNGYYLGDGAASGFGEFLPAASYRSDDGVRNPELGMFGYYWSSTPYQAIPDYGGMLWFTGNLLPPATLHIAQGFGLTVRCVPQLTSDKYHTVNFSAQTGGSVSTTSARAADGTLITSTATVKTDYTFDGWYSSGSSTPISAISGAVYVSNNGLTLNVKSSSSVNNKTYEARFIRTYTVNFTTAGSGGSVGTTSSTGVAGDPLSCTAQIGSGYDGVTWYGADGVAIIEINDTKDIYVKGKSLYVKSSSSVHNKTFTARFGKGAPRITLNG
ncbi:MAG: InlB B-repeat-containing protein, partial [Bacteroidales bacterium]